MHRLIPEFIQEHYAAKRTSGSFFACAAFVDISGFTAISDALMEHGQHGAEVLAKIVRDVFDPLIQSFYEQGGFVTNLAGDAFTAVFPVDGDSPDPFYRALAAAWQIQQFLVGSSHHQTPYGDFAVSVKVGLAAGEVAWGILSSTDRNRAAYYFQGPAFDGCTRAEKLAQAGELIVDAAVFGKLGTIALAEPIEDHFRITAINGTLPLPQPINLRPVEPDILIRFFPPEAARQTLSGEFRQVVSMFVSLPTVQTAEQLEIFMQIVFSLQDRYGGFLNRLDFGDKGANLLLFWGAPIAHENDLARALNFILDLQAQTAVPVNAGVTYRAAHVGYSGGALAGEYTCYGGGITLAARLMQASPRGEVWVDENVAERASATFEVDFEDEMVFKGFTQEQKVFVLLERKQETKPFYINEMVGRQDELTKLVEFVQPIWQDQYAGTLIIWGDPGIGKSRLVHGFLGQLESSNKHAHSVFLCQTDEILRESLNPFRYWLRSYFGQSEQQSVARNKRSFNRKLDHLVAVSGDEVLIAELDRTRSFLGALVDLYWPDSLYEQLDARGRHENSFSGLLSLLMAESLQQPLILLLEDVQWLDEDTKDFLAQLEQVLTQNQRYPIAILATARPEGIRGELGDHFTYQEIDLSQMTPNDLAALAANQLGSPIGADLFDLLEKRAEGNPFFAEQTLRYLQEQNLLVQVEREWLLKAFETATLPTDVRAVLVARLDRLTYEVKDVVQTAAVLGREFEIRLLARMLKNDPTIREKVEQAEHASIWSALTELRYLFKHTLLRDAAYHMQVRTRRESLHKLASEALEDLHADNPSPYYGELAFHTEQARLIDKARHYLELAGAASEEAYQNSLAIDYYSRALNLSPEEDLDSRYRLLRAREKLYDRQGARREQLQDQRAMSALAEQLKDVSKQVEVLIRSVWFSYSTADFPKALETARQATTLAEVAGERRLAGQAHYLRSWALLQQGAHSDARLEAEAALAAARDSNDFRGAGNVLNALGMISRAEGDFFAMRVHLEEFLVNSRNIADREREATALANLGVANTLLGQYAIAQDYFEQSLAISREIGDRNSYVVHLINLSWVAVTQGKWDLAIKHGEAGIAIARETTKIEVEAEGLIWLGHALFGLGQPNQAIAAYQESLNLRRKLGQEYLAMEVLGGMARAAVAQGDLDSATRYVAEIISYLDTGGSLDGTWEPLRIYLTCYQILQLAQESRAVDFLETAYQQLQKLASQIPEIEMRRMFLENVPWHREIIAAHHEITSSD